MSKGKFSKPKYDEIKLLHIPFQVFFFLLPYFIFLPFRISLKLNPYSAFLTF